MLSRLPPLALALCACSAIPQFAAEPSASCPIAASSDWRAWVNVIPGRMNTHATLHVIGKVTVPSGEWAARFSNIRVMESYPVQIIVELEATSSGAGIQVPIEREVRGSWHTEPAVGSVTIMCRGTTLARIAPVDRAD